MRTRPPARPSRPRRPVAALAALSLAALLAACGSSSGSGGPASGAPASVPPASVPAATAAGGGGGGGPADCAAATKAAEDVSIQMQLLYQVDSAASWKSMADPTSPLPLDAVRFAKAVAVIGAQPGGADIAAKYRPIADLMTQAAAASDPWGSGSGPAAQAHAKALAGFIDLGVALSTWLQTNGCKR